MSSVAFDRAYLRIPNGKKNNRSKLNVNAADICSVVNKTIKKGW